MNESQIKTLENLATFKFLTVEQMALLKVRKSRASIYETLPRLRDIKSPLIKRASIGVDLRYGRISDLYYLTVHGVNWLIENQIMELDSIRYPKGKVDVAFRDYKHRIGTINIHIFLKLWLDTNEGDIELASSYFDKPGSQRKGEPLIVNKIELTPRRYLVPDLIIKICRPHKSSAFAFEQHNGKDTKKLIGQIEAHAEAIEQGLISDKINFNKATRVCIVFEYETLMNKAMERLNSIENLQRFKPFFLFKHQDTLPNDFSTWSHWDFRQEVL